MRLLILSLWLAVSTAQAGRNFNGSSQYLNAGSAIITTQPFTVACWFKVTNTTASHVLWSSGVSSNQNRYGLSAAGAVAGDPVRAYTTNTAASIGVASSTVGFSANTWQHAAGVWVSNSSRTVYLNGGNSASDTTAIGAGTPTETYIGVQSVNGTLQNYVSGDIAEVAIWSVALDAAEINALAKGFRPTQIRPQSLVSYTPLIADLRDLKRGATWTDHSSTVSAHCRRYGQLSPLLRAWVAFDLLPSRVR